MSPPPQAKTTRSPSSCSSTRRHLIPTTPPHPVGRGRTAQHWAAVRAAHRRRTRPAGDPQAPLAELPEVREYNRVACRREGGARAEQREGRGRDELGVAERRAAE